MIESHMKQ